MPDDEFQKLISQQFFDDKISSAISNEKKAKKSVDNKNIVLDPNKKNKVIFEDIHRQIQTDDLFLIPAAMQQEKRWICWGSDKVPVSVGKNQSGEHFGIDVTKPANWGTFADAVAALGDECFVKSSDEHFHVVGIGFIVGDGWFCADFDGGEKHRKEPVPGSVIEDVISRVGTYTELSLSGCGYHVFGRCDFVVGNDEPENNLPHRDSNGVPVPDSYEVEFFSRRKFIAITGNIVSGSSPEAVDCSAAARDLYERYILNDWRRDEEKRKAERQRVAASTPINADDATKFFLLNYPEILAFSDSSDFKRGGKGHPLGSGEYSWIGAVKSMQQIGVPEDAIMDWCRRGSNFKSERDVQKVLNEAQKPGKSCIGSIIQNAQKNGWKPDPEKLTGKYKEAYEARLEREKDVEEWGKEFAELQRQKAAITALGFEYSDALTCSYTLDGSVEKVIDTETGEILYTAPDPDANQPVPGSTVYTAPDPIPGQAEPEKWKPIEKLPPLPEFPLDVFPDWIQGYINNYHENTGVSKDFCAACILGAISTAINGHLQIRFNGHNEAGQLYILFVGRSGTMKSSTLSQFYEPITRWLSNKNREIIEFNQEVEKRIYKLEQKKKDKKSKEDPEQIDAEIEQERAKLKPEYPVMITDPTPQALERRMAAAGGCATMASSEGDSIHLLTGNSKKGEKPHIDVFLKGHDGEPIVIARVGEGKLIQIDSANLSLLLAIQPDLLEEISRDKDSIGRGLVQRFLIFAPEQEITLIDHTLSCTLDYNYRVQWEEHIQSIADIYMKPEETPILLTLDSYSDYAIRSLWNYTESIIGGYTDDSARGWISKMRGKAMRLAAILTVIDDPAAAIIPFTSTEKAIRLLRDYFFPHYMRSYEREAELPVSEKKIIEWLKKHCRKTGGIIKQSELWTYIRQVYPFKSYHGKEKNDIFVACLTSLFEKSYIRPYNDDSKTVYWEVNPAIMSEEKTGH